MSNKFPNAHSSAQIQDASRVHESIYVGPGSVVYPRVDVAKDVAIGSSTYVHEDSIIGRGVRIGPRVVIGGSSLILSRARICPNDVESVSSDGRKIGFGSTIGENVLLHDEVELAEFAIVPNQRTIASLGNLGTKNRVITIYGTDLGPAYSIGCQIGQNYNSIVSKIRDPEYHEITTVSSAATYAPYLSVLDEIGYIVQQAYEDSAGQVEELKAMRDELGLNRSIEPRF